MKTKTVSKVKEEITSKHLIDQLNEKRAQNEKDGMDEINAILKKRSISLSFTKTETVMGDQIRVTPSFSVFTIN